MPQILVIPSFEVFAFSPLITLIISSLSPTFKNKFSIQEPTQSFRMFKLLIPADEQTASELMTQLPQWEILSLLNQLAKERQKRLSLSFVVFPITKLGKTSRSIVKSVRASNHSSQLKECFFLCCSPPILHLSIALALSFACPGSYEILYYFLILSSDNLPLRPILVFPTDQ